MIWRKRVFLSVVIIVVMFAGLAMANPAEGQAPRRPTATPTAIPVPTVPPDTYFVSVSGNDTNPGTLAAPWRHIQYAMDRVGPGSTVNVLTGVYNEFVTFKNSGSSGNYIVLQNYTGSRIVAMSFCEPRSWTRVLSFLRPLGLRLVAAHPVCYGSSRPGQHGQCIDGSL